MRISKRQVAAAAFFAGYTAALRDRDLWKALAAFQASMPKRRGKNLSARAAT
jgi:hypothetical protein